MLGRIYSVPLVAITAEAIVNGLGQIAFLNQQVFQISAALLVISVFGVVVSQWFVPSQSNFWLRAVALVALGLILTWPLHFDATQATPQNFQPWIWWPLGIATVAAGATFRFGFGILYLLIMTISWPILKVSGFGGAGQLVLGVQEALHLFVFSSVLIAMVLALRWEAGKTDSANQDAINSAVESARVAAFELERSRLDALVHDSVLTTLLVASQATTQDQRALASKSAIDAIARLNNFRTQDSKLPPLTVASFFQALELRIKEASEEFEVSLDKLSDLPIPSITAEALTEATLQAVDNSTKHAGFASERMVRLRGQKNGVKIVITDNGQGFRPSQVPKDRIGIASSIVSRVVNVGGRVFINSSPGTGTAVVIEWGNDD
jgi:signal transduction histidine kinase